MLRFDPFRTLVAGIARREMQREISLRTTGVDFGTLRVTAAGEIDPTGMGGVDAHLVAKPFGWK